VPVAAEELVLALAAEDEGDPLVQIAVRDVVAPGLLSRDGRRRTGVDAPLEAARDVTRDAVELGHDLRPERGAIGPDEREGRHGEQVDVAVGDRGLAGLRGDLPAARRGEGETGPRDPLRLRRPTAR